MVSPRGGSNVQVAWLIGGALLLAMVVLGVATGPVAELAVGAAVFGTALFSTSVLVFAFGIRGSGSVTARRPLGTSALTVLAVWLLLVSVLINVVDLSGVVSPDVMFEFGYVDVFVLFALALIAVSQIGRAGVVPAPWNWAPAWALVAVSAAGLLTQIVASGTAQDANAAVVLSIVVEAVDGILRAGSVVFLGVLAIVLADRSSRPQPVSVPPTSDVPQSPTN